MIDSKVIEAFQLMWGNFPDPALLIHKNREIIALNEAGRKMGRVAGTICSSYGGPEAHRHCLANQALATGRPAFVKRKNGARDRISYWLPLEGQPDLFVHFIVGAMVDYDAAPEKAAGV